MYRTKWVDGSPVPPGTEPIETVAYGLTIRTRLRFVRDSQPLILETDQYEILRWCTGMRDCYDLYVEQLQSNGQAVFDTVGFDTAYHQLIEVLQRYKIVLEANSVTK